jgi:peptidoglycan/LPS O-acetylase OafA/YrhL
VVAEIERWCWIFLGLAVPLLLLATFGSLAWYMSEEDETVFLMVQLTSAAASWTTILALAGCCGRLLKRERPFIRYMVDASYWIYLAHMPLTIFIPALFRYWDTSGLLKMTVSITLTMIVLLLSYHLLVRNTAIGLVLSGRRYPAWPFGRTPHPEPPPTE